MAETPQISPQEFGGAFKKFLDQAVTSAPEQQPFFAKLLEDHLDRPLTSLPIVGEEFETIDHPNLQIALETITSKQGTSSRILGIAAANKAFMPVSLSDLTMPANAVMAGTRPPTEGPVEFHNVFLEEGRVVSCIQFGLNLISIGERRLAVLVRGPRERRWEKIQVQVMSARPEHANEFLAELRSLMRKKSVYRGRVLSLSMNEMRQLDVAFTNLPSIGAENIILPEGILKRIRRHTVDFANLKEQLLRSGRHLKRGILLHGPPGTGKTLTAMHLSNQMKDRTVLLLTGRNLSLIKQTCAMARMLEPSMVVLEDVDLVAEERTSQAACTPVLFDLLNEMDGLNDDADIIFLLTTNRPDLLEPALAARPGRIDQAVEVPLPDDLCRRRLIELYAKGLDLNAVDKSRLVQRTKGVSAAFIRELMRKAALFAADGGNANVVSDKDMDDALFELTVEGGNLTQSLLGIQNPQTS